MTISEFFKEKYSARKDKENIYGVGMSDAEFRHFIIQYLLPENWYVVDPIGQSQVNEIAINEILTKYSKKFRKERKKYLKELRGGIDDNHTCNCQHNSNSRDNEPCCRCDSKLTNAEIVKVDSLEIIVRMIENKPYYEVKYREVGKEDYSIGYSSYDLNIVLGFIAEYFEIVERDRQTNADRIRNISDEEFADVLFDSCLEVMHIDECPYADNIRMCKKCVSEWLQSEAE